MHLYCPNCRVSLDIVATEPVNDLSCPSCGSLLSSGEPDTVTFQHSHPKRIGRYELHEVLGIGAHGMVRRGVDTTLERDVAIKLPRLERDDDKSTLNLLLHEARSAAKIKHANIVPILDVGTEGNVPFIVSQLVDGEPLSDFISRRRRLDDGFGEKDAVEICLPLASALHTAHESGIIHRDLKPSNIMVSSEGVPYVMDFGLAKIETADFTITTAGQIVGTMRYMPPDQARGNSR